MQLKEAPDSFPKAGHIGPSTGQSSLREFSGSKREIRGKKQQPFAFGEDHACGARSARWVLSRQMSTFRVLPNLISTSVVSLQVVLKS